MSSIPKKYKAGEYLFHDGDASNCMFLVSKGTVSIRKGADNVSIEISKIYTNEVIGELSFFDRRPRSASAMALTDVEVVEIPFESLDVMYHKVPPYLKTIMASVAERFRKSNEMIRKLEKQLAKFEYRPGADGDEEPKDGTPKK